MVFWEKTLFSKMRLLEEEEHDDHDEHEDHDDHDDHGDETTGVKILIFFLLLIAGLFVFVPFTKCVKSNDSTKKRSRCLSISNSFAAGMILSLAICHILPEADMLYKESLAGHDHGHEEHDEHDDHSLLRVLEGHEVGVEEGEHEDHDDHDEDHDEHEDDHGEFPLPYVMFTVGFCIIFFFDQVLFKSPQK